MDAAGNGILYLGSLIYRKEGNSIGLERAIFDGGMYVALSGNGSALIPQIHVTDHLGSVRAIVDSSSGAPLETNNFYPYGKRWDEAASLYDQSNRYMFNGKEVQVTGGIGLTDYGARYYGISPYAFCGNNPVNFVDPDGEAWGKAFKIVKKVYKTAKAGNKVSVKGILKSEALELLHSIWPPDSETRQSGLQRRSGFRMRLTGKTPDASKHAHHIFPKAIEQFKDANIDPNDPRYGIWLDADLHLGGRANLYNAAWNDFFGKHPNPTTDELFEYARKLMKDIYDTDVF